MGAATEAVTVRPTANALPRTERISRSVKRAIDHMVIDGLHRRDAAKAAGIAEHSLYVAMRKPSVIAYRNTLLGVVRESAASRTIAKAEKLMDSASSEHVQADMTKWLAGLEGISPITKSENVNHNNSLTPGLTINLVIGQADGAQALLIDGQPLQVGSGSRPNGLPQPVPHPSMRNAAILAPAPEKPAAARKRPRGEK